MKVLLNRINVWRGIAAIVFLIIGVLLLWQGKKYIDENYVTELSMGAFATAFGIIFFDIFINSRIETIQNKRELEKEKTQATEADEKEVAQLGLRLAPLASQVTTLDSQIEQLENRLQELEKYLDLEKFGEVVRLASLNQYVELLDKVVLLRRQRLECRREISSIAQQLGSNLQMIAKVGYDINKRFIERH